MKKTLLSTPSNCSTSFLKYIALVLLIIGGAFSVQAQVANYAYAETKTGQTYGFPAGTFTTATTIVTGMSGTFTNLTPVLVNIGFTFNFNGVNYTQTSVSDNGFITFGGTAPASAYITPISVTSTYNGAISSYGFDLVNASQSASYTGLTSDVTYSVIDPDNDSSTLNSIFVVQYRNMVRRSGLSKYTGLLNMQIRLYQGTNTVETIYDAIPVTPAVVTGLPGQLGLRGATNADFNNRKVGAGSPDWVATAAGLVNSDTMPLTATNYPVTVTKCTWTPPCYSPIGLAATTAVNSVVTWTAPTPSAAGYIYEVRSSGAFGSGATGLFTSGSIINPTVTFTATGLSEGVIYTVYVQSSCGGTVASTTVTPPCSLATIPYSQLFETVTVPAIPNCTTITNSGTTLGTVDRSITPLGGFTTKNLVTTGALASNSWYFTQQITFPSAGYYKLKYTYGGTSTAAIQKMKVAYGAVNSQAGMTTVITDDSNIKTSPITNTANFYVSSSGNYYIGFNAYADATQGSLQLDDIYLAAATCLPATALSSGQITSSSAIISWTPPSSAPSGGYSYYVSSSATSPSDITVATGITAAGVNAASLSALSASTPYYFWVRSNCGGGELSSWSNSATFTTLAPPAPAPTGYCVPTQSGGSQVSSVKFKTINNTVVQSSPYYDDYPASGTTTTNVRVTQTYPITVTTSGSAIVSVWIDFNRNAVFDTTEWYQVYTTGTSGTVNITIPLTASGGLTKMRVRSRATGNPNASADACTTFFSGSTQDYTILIDATPPPVLTISGTSTAICSGATTANINITSTIGDFNVYTWSPSTGVTTVSPGVYNFNPTTTTSYTLTGQQTSGNFDTNTAVYTVTVNPLPTAIVISPSSATICQSATTTQSLVATGGIVPNIIVPAVSEDFNSGIGTYTKVNSSVGGNLAAADWTLFTSPSTITSQTVSSNDNSQFFSSNSDSQGSGTTTNVQLISPAFDLSTYTDASLSFWHYYRSWSNGSANVEISTNGGTTWTTLSTYTSTSQGTPSGFVNVVISLNSYVGVGMTNLKIRFYYTANYGYNWNVDNVRVSGSTSSTVTWSPITDLYTDVAGTIAYVAAAPAATVYVKTLGTSPLAYTASVTSPSGCPASTIVNIAVNPKPTVTITTPPANVCANSVLPVNVTGNASTYTWTSSVANTLFSDATGTTPYIGGTNTPIIYVKAPNTATITATGTSVLGCLDISTVVFTVATKTYSAGSWTPVGIPPATGGTDNLVLSSPWTGGNLSGCSCTVTGGATVFASGETLTLTNGLAVSGGSLTFNNGASLIQTNNVANTGNIIYNRDTTAILRFDYTYWSTPVSPQTIVGFTPLSPLAYTYNGTWASVPTSTTMSVAKGYSVRAPTSITAISPPVITSVSFVGAPNNGTYTTPITGGTFNLIGNPYPSALMADEFLKLSNNPALDGTIYLWTHNTPINVAYQYTGSDYALYNLSGGVGTATTSTYSGVGSGRLPLGFIAAGQGFMIKGLSNGVANFTNAMRAGGANNSQFFRTSNSSQTNSVLEKNRLWLDITNTEGAFKQVLVGYIQDATNGLDRGFDGEMVDNGNVITFYTTVETKKLSIQGKALPFDVADMIPLGYKSTINGTYTISLSDFDGLFTDQNVYLEDTVTGEIHDMKSSPYTFATVIGAFENRFVLRFTNTTLAIALFNANSVVVYKNDLGLHITTGNVVMKSVTIYDVTGRLIASRDNISASETVFTALPTTKQVLLVEITSEAGEKVSKKVVY